MKNWTLISTFNFFAFILISALPGALTVHAEEFVTLDELFDEGISEVATGIQDPFEAVNRLVFKFNDFLYLNVFSPVAVTYDSITPDPLEKGLSNFFDNLKYPVRLAGNLLQGKWGGATIESGRFIINSTFGLAGFARPSDSFSLLESPPVEDVGQALGSWGFDEGPYLLLPVLGPSSFRGLVGRIGDRVVDPFRLPLTQFDEWEVRALYTGGGILVNTPTMVDRYMQMKGGALDPYIALRNGYFQYRVALIKE